MRLPIALLLLVVPCLAQQSEPAVRWTDARTLGVEGQGWTDTKHPFDRFPARAEGIVRKPVYARSRSFGLAGMALART